MQPTDKIHPKHLLGALCILLLTSCQPYEPYTREEVFKGAYARNFIRTFGAIDPEMSWDFTDGRLRGKRPVQTRAGEDDLAALTDENGWFYVDTDLYNQVISRTKTTEITDKSFAFLIGENDCFEIYPIYLTASENGKISWSLQMLVDKQNVINSSSDKYQGWKMGYNVEIKESKDGPWSDFLARSKCIENRVRSKPIIHYESKGEKKLMHLALHISPDNLDIEQYAIPQSQQSSLHRQMRILDIPPTWFGNNLQTLFVACEAADIDGKLYTNYRYRSLVLMIVGPSIPQVIYLRKDNEGKEWIDYEGNAKRYMIEDLGSASDFDFNDVVVDVVQASSAQVLINQESHRGTNAKLTTARLGETQAQETHATIRYLCGTRPFRLSVGDYSFERVTDPTDRALTRKQLMGEATEEEASYYRGAEEIMGWEPNVQAFIPSWDPTSNRVSIEVWPNESTDVRQGGWRAQFPGMGEVPYIMALPTCTRWSEEGVLFSSWADYLLP